MLQGVAEHVITRNQKLQDMISGMGETTEGITDTANKLKELTSTGATNIQNKAMELNTTRSQRVQDRKKLDGSSLSKSIESAVSPIQNSMASLDNNLNDVTGGKGSKGSGGKGSKALKTTSSDEVSISDEDLQFLFDIATRDYKLNYQQVTPNITMTFGDIRETADVDMITDQLADRLQEIYDGSLTTA